MAVHVGMQDLEKSGRCDVLQTVSKLRLDRGGVVQTKDQYVLIYMVSCVLETKRHEALLSGLCFRPYTRTLRTCRA